MEKALEEAKQANSKKRIVINLAVDNKLLLERIINRRMCKSCGKIYNLKTLPPKNGLVCDDCGEELYQRDDDTEAIATKRFDTYNTQTEPLIEYYSKKGLLVNVDGNNSPDEIYQSILNVIK